MKVARPKDLPPPHRAISNGSARKPILFLDMDGVLCLSESYGSYELKMVVQRGHEFPDFYEKLFSRSAVETLNAVLAEFQPLVVISSTWTRYFGPEVFTDTFAKTGIKGLNLHEQWWLSSGWTPDDSLSRLAAISAWLADFHQGEPFVILDDNGSGYSLSDSKLDGDGRVALCDYKAGLGDEHLGVIRHALMAPVNLCPEMLSEVIPPRKRPTSTL